MREHHHHRATTSAPAGQPPHHHRATTAGAPPPARGTHPQHPPGHNPGTPTTTHTPPPHTHNGDSAPQVTRGIRELTVKDIDCALATRSINSHTENARCQQNT